MMSYGFWRKSEFIRIPPHKTRQNLLWGGILNNNSPDFWNLNILLSRKTMRADDTTFWSFAVTETQSKFPSGTC